MSAPGSESSKQSDGDGMSQWEIAAFVIPLLLILLLFCILFIWYKKRYSCKHRPGGKWFKVKPEPLSHDQTNYLYNYQVMGRTWGERTSEVDKRALISDTPTSQLSLSSGSGDVGYGQLPETDPDPSKEDGTGGSSSTSGIGLSQTNLQEEAFMETRMEHSKVILADSGDTQFTHNKASDKSPNSMSHNDHSTVRTLPILAPIRSSQEPSIAPLKSVSTPVVGNGNNIHSYGMKSPRAALLEPIPDKDKSEHRKRRKRKRRENLNGSTNSNIAMKSITSETVIQLPPSSQLVNGESNA